MGITFCFFWILIPKRILLELSNSNFYLDRSCMHLCTDIPEGNSNLIEKIYSGGRLSREAFFHSCTNGLACVLVTASTTCSMLMNMIQYWLHYC